MLKTAGTALQVAGAALLATAHVWPPACYALMLAGALCWLTYGALAKDKHLIVLNGCWILLNTVGLVMWSR